MGGGVGRSRVGIRVLFRGGMGREILWWGGIRQYDGVPLVCSGQSCVMRRIRGRKVLR